MKYRLLKKMIDKVFMLCSGVHSELKADELKQSIGKMGVNSTIEYPFRISEPENVFIGDRTYICEGCRIDSYYVEMAGEYGKVHIGDGCYLGFNLSILAGSNINIGKDVLIASNVLITSENHGINPMDDHSYMHQPLLGKKTSIGDGCWIGEKAQILPGVTIGEKSIIAAGAVVTHSIPPYSIAGGNPAKIIKKYNFNKNKWERTE